MSQTLWLVKEFIETTKNTKKNVIIFWSRLFDKTTNQITAVYNQGIIYLNRNGNSATFFSYVCNAIFFKELFYPA